ncbi:GlmL-related ornithine degradation protein [Thermosediminibacter oceani]|uniref:GlmL-related ornithine degradation protein n=1 Tax=Thermosediminibacter oceani TaxID=291990 RepID=UPI00059D8DA6
MEVDVLVAEIGSTTTLVNAFKGLGTPCPEFVGQGLAPTTVLQGDVTVGLEGAVKDLEKRLGKAVKWKRMMATSSAAGGLKMTVHGLVYDMTAKAAKEAALGAGAVLHMMTAGFLSQSDLEKIRKIKPNIILLAGGVDYGEKKTVIENARKIAEHCPDIPVIYAGNVAAREEVAEIFSGKNRVFFVENVYPRIDELNVEPARRVIQQVFEEHIVVAPGMEKIRTMVDGPIVPTPGAVMMAALLLKEDIGDLIVVDVGGATTDVHSVTEGSEEINRILIAPEPAAKRTVEGDLGVYVNRYNVVEVLGFEEARKKFGDNLSHALEVQPPVPKNQDEVWLAEFLTEIAAVTAVNRHAGGIKHLYGPTGRYTVAEGKDLTGVKWIIGTGGALTRLPGGRRILEKIRSKTTGKKLLPGEDARVLIDRDYIMASTGVLSKEYPDDAIKLLKKSLRINDVRTD